MIPIKLTLQGIYSYREKQTIEFDRLTSAGLFGIFGQVGSGKSTILEAISFVVYGHTERLNQKEERYYNMMNLKSNEMLIDFECLAGDKNSEKFRFVVRSKRSGSNFNEVRFSGRDIYKFQNNDWTPIEEDPTDIVGLSYENFRRTTIIPQGKFQEFLHLTDADRTRMLREIFGLHKFELYNKTTQVESKYREQMQTVNGKLSMLGDLNEAEIEGYQKQLENVRAEIEKVNEELKELQEQEKEFSSLKGVFAKLKTLKQREEELEKDEEEFVRRREFLKDYKYCRINFQSLLDKKVDLTRSINRELSSINSKKEKLNVISQTLDEGKEKFAEIETRYESRENINKKIEDLSTLARIAELQEKLPELNEKIDGYDDKITLIQAKKREFAAKDQEAASRIEELKKSRADVSELSEIQAWFMKRDQLREEKLKLDSDYTETKETLAEYDSKVKNIVDSIPVLATDEELDHGELLERIVRKKGELKKETERIQYEISHLQLKNKLGDYAKELEDGKACPLCGATDHPNVVKIEDVSEKMQQLEDSLSQTGYLIAELDDAMKKIEMVGFSRGETLKKLSSLEYSIKSNTDNQRIQDAGFTWDNFDKENSESVNAGLEENKKIEDEIISLEESREAARANISRLDGEGEELTAERQELLNDKNSRNTELETIKKQVNSAILEEYSDKEAGELKIAQEEMKREISEIVSTYTSLKKELETLSSDYNTYSGEVNALEAGIKGRKEELENLELEILGKVDESRFDELVKIEEILSNEINIDYEENDIDEYFSEMRDISKNITSLKEELGDKDYDEQKHENIIKRLTELDESKSELFQKRGNIGQLLDQFNRSLEAKKDLEKELEELKVKTENIRVIKNMFKGSGFVNYVSTVYLKTLCAAANERFMKLTLGRLSLELNQQNNFVIRDFLNDGQVRNVKTLSGGQTFQAALSLALALSDSIQKTAGSEQNFFFLDEGFGTLDKESLNMVFDTLKALRKENRVVGVISHVEEMQEEIEASINIINDPERGSVLTMK